METVLNTFAELAKLYGNDVKAKEMLAHPPLIQIQDSLGDLCAILWCYIQEREACKKYGDKGNHICTPAMLAEESGFPVYKVERALIRLLCAGHLRTNGREVKAA